MSDAIQKTGAITDSETLARANFEVLRRAGRKASTVHQYTQTEAQWTAFCRAQGYHPANFEVVYVDAFFQSIREVYSRTSLQNKLSHLRKLVEAMASASDETAALYMRQLQALRQYKIGDDWGGTNQRKRGGKRLSSGTVYAAIQADASNPLMQTRNAAFYALLFFAGLRREELRQLQWAHVNFDNDTLRVVGGKKRAADQYDDVPMLGELRGILLQWRAVQMEAAGGATRQYVICAVYKGGKLRADKPLASGAVYELIRPFETMPHDARHTLASNLVEKVPLSTAQKIMRHKRAETTMRYAHALEAEQLAKTVRNPYG